MSSEHCGLSFRAGGEQRGQGRFLLLHISGDEGISEGPGALLDTSHLQLQRLPSKRGTERGKGVQKMDKPIVPAAHTTWIALSEP